MPKVKIQGDKVIVCCGDNDCIEIDTSRKPGGNLPPYQPPPISGGVAIYVDQPNLLVSPDNDAGNFWDNVKVVETQLGYLGHSEVQKHKVHLVMLEGSKLRLDSLQHLANRLVGANLEITFTDRSGV